MIRRNLIKTAIGAGLLPFCNVFGENSAENTNKVGEFEDIAAKIMVWLPKASSNCNSWRFDKDSYQLINTIHNNETILNFDIMQNMYMTAILAAYHAKSLSKKVMILDDPTNIAFWRLRFECMRLNDRNIFIFGETDDFYEKMDIGYCLDKNLSYMRRETRAVSKMKEIYTTE